MTMGSSQENSVLEKDYFDLVSDKDLVPHPLLSFLTPIKKGKSLK